MNPEQVKETITIITGALQPLADKLGVTTEYIFRLAVKQVYVVAAIDALIWIILTLAGYFYISFCKRYLDHEAYEGITAAVFLAGIALAIGWVVMVSEVISYVPQAVFNPEWAAIEMIFEMVK